MIHWHQCYQKCKEQLLELRFGEYDFESTNILELTETLEEFHIDYPYCSAWPSQSEGILKFVINPSKSLSFIVNAHLDQSFIFVETFGCLLCSRGKLYKMKKSIFVSTLYLSLPQKKSICLHGTILAIPSIFTLMSLYSYYSQSHGFTQAFKTNLLAILVAFFLRNFCSSTKLFYIWMEQVNTTL